MKHLRSLPLLLAGLAALAAPAAAHDLWIAPSSYRPAVGEVVRVHLRVGDQPAKAEAVIRDPDRLLRLSVFEAGRDEAAVPGFDGQDPAGFWKPSTPGTALLAYESGPRPIELPAERFEHYLVEEGLEPIAAERARRGETATAGRELYSRSVKSLVVVGAGTAHDRAVGLPLEFVVEGELSANLALRLLWHGAPVADALVEVVALEGEPTRLVTRSDHDGRSRFTLPRAGRWFVSTVHMERLPPGQGAEWRSTWTSLSCEIPAASPIAAPADAGESAPPPPAPEHRGEARSEGDPEDHEPFGAM